MISKTFASLFAMTVGLVTLAGCSAAPATESEGIEFSEDELSVDGSAQDVSWTYTDKIGRGIEEQFSVDGQIAIRLIGGLEAVDDSFGRPAKVQSARVSMRVPDFKNPDNLVVRRYFVRFETFDNGNTLETSGWGNALIVDRSLPGAASTFESSRPGIYLSNGVSMLSIKLRKEGAGSFAPEIYLSSPFFVQQHAEHNITISTN